MDTGEEIWMRPFVEDHMGKLAGAESTTTGDPDAPSWPMNEDGTDKKEPWYHGGGAPWQSASFDPVTNKIIIGTGNPAPWNTWERSEGKNFEDFDSL